ncbi:hypothetical protein [Aureimonas leprariae]|uniref:Uncharacterized protein n=1 Tax=Plantimonas leprariae TaxID=2615207 RepID=A0A7V7TXH5_9HYPH|nr:hypothetical protein [Aureimonas leprariae]KAB0680882.1 hypothetical protein F6X38_07815 [Aureimonas leprariae]
MKERIAMPAFDRFGFTRRASLIAMSGIVLLSASDIASAVEPAGWSRPLHGVVVPLPPEWTSEYDPGKGGEAQSLNMKCNTAECEATQEVCTVVVTNDPISDPGSSRRPGSFP